MLVNPELWAWLSRQSQTVTEKGAAKPLVAKAEKIHKGGPKKTRRTAVDEQQRGEGEEEVEYLNDRKSNLNLYA